MYTVLTIFQPTVRFVLLIEFRSDAFQICLLKNLPPIHYDESNNLTQEEFNCLKSRKLSTGNLSLYINELEWRSHL